MRKETEDDQDRVSALNEPRYPDAAGASSLAYPTGLGRHQRAGVCFGSNRTQDAPGLACIPLSRQLWGI